jgi:radical SAM-linked protein
MRYTSHLDTHRTWERMVRRARLPLVYSQGFNPRPKINLASALPLGFTSSCELADIWLDQDLPEKQVKAQLQDAEPPGLQIIQVGPVDLKGSKLPNLVQSAEYIITLIEPIGGLEDRISRILGSERLVRERRGKEYDLRPLVEEIERINPGPGGEPRFRLRLAARTGATGRPDEVLSEMRIPIQNTRVHRTNLILKSDT